MSFVQTRLAHLNKLTMENGVMLFVRYGSLKFALQTQCSWNQLTLLKIFLKHDGNSLVTFVSGAMEHAFSVLKQTAIQPSMLRVRNRQDYI